MDWTTFVDSIYLAEEPVDALQIEPEVIVYCESLTVYVLRDRLRAQSGSVKVAVLCNICAPHQLALTTFTATLVVWEVVSHPNCGILAQIIVLVFHFDHNT